MSRKTELLADLRAAGRRAGGSHLTIEARDRHLRKFVAFCREANYGLQSVDQIKTKHLVAYAQCLMAGDYGARTLHNHLASVRCALRAAGKNLANMHLTANADLGLPTSSRPGTKEPIPQALYEEAVVKARKRDAALAIGLGLERYAGLRAMEMLRSHLSHASWMGQLRSGPTISVVFGTKGGRGRNVMIRPNDVAIVIDLLAEARALTEAGKSPLIRAPSLEQADARYHYLCGRIGLVGIYAPHSLRYRYTVEMVKYLFDQGYTHREALAMLALDLGHGDDRGRWVQMVYARKID